MREDWVPPLPPSDPLSLWERVRACPGLDPGVRVPPQHRTSQESSNGAPLFAQKFPGCPASLHRSRNPVPTTPVSPPSPFPLPCPHHSRRPVLTIPVTPSSQTPPLRRTLTSPCNSPLLVALTPLRRLYPFVIPTRPHHSYPPTVVPTRPHHPYPPSSFLPSPRHSCGSRNPGEGGAHLRRTPDGGCSPTFPLSLTLSHQGRWEGRAQRGRLSTDVFACVVAMRTPHRSRRLRLGGCDSPSPFDRLRVQGE